MFQGNYRWINQAMLSLLVLLFCSWGLVGCGEGITETSLPPEPEPEEILVEVAPPFLIQQLSSNLDLYQPQVAILNPQIDQVVTDTKVEVKLEVRDLPIFQNEEWGLGPHLNVLLDNQPYTRVYDLEEPLILEDLAPGTHTLRVFASLPWDESFKNEGAYAQTSFHVFTKTQSNNPDLLQPLLTYGTPQGSYGAEPIMVDFYLNNAPLHLVAQGDSVDEISDWLVRTTINGQSFLLDSLQPVYLEGFEPGINWIRVELLDEMGNLIDNEFNDIARVITYEPGGQDSLSKIVRGELVLAQVQGIVDSDYIYEEEVTTPETPTVLPEEEEVIELDISEETEKSQEEEIVSEQTEQEEEIIEDSEAIESTVEEEVITSEEIDVSSEDEVIESILEEETGISFEDEEIESALEDKADVSFENEEIESILEEEVIPSEEIDASPEDEEIESTLEEEADVSFEDEEIITPQEIDVFPEDNNIETFVEEEVEASEDNNIEDILSEDDKVTNSQEMDVSEDEESDVPESELLKLEATELTTDLEAES